MFSSLLFCMLGLPAPALTRVVPTDTVTIYGYCWDVSTGMDIKVKATALMKNEKFSLGESDDDGKFEFRLPESAQHIVFEREGYRTETVPVNFIGKMERNFRFRANLEMIKVDSQQVNKVLFKDVSDPAERISGKKNVRFEIREAKNRRLLNAKVCLNFTQTGKVECHNIDTSSVNSSISVGLQDKISLIVSAPGYKDYIGTLINGQTENKEELYQIRLLSDDNPLSMFLDAPANLPISYYFSKTKEGKFGKNPWIDWGNPQQFFSYIPFLETGNYYLTATIDTTVLLDQNFTIQRGFNFMLVNPKEPGTKPALISKITKMKSSEIPAEPVKETGLASVKNFDSTVLYFDQSSYHLRNATKLTLDSISRLLAAQKGLKVSITGHSDNVGKRDLNVTLSEYRARVVTNYLRKNGVQPTQLSYTWKGPDSPTAANDNPENKMKNRRVVIRYEGR